VKTQLEILKEARALIEKGWCQGYNYEWDGFDAMARREDASRFCPHGALLVVTGNSLSKPLLAAERRLSKFAGYRYVDWNDVPGRTQKEVLALFDRAISECEAEQAASS